MQTFKTLDDAIALAKFAHRNQTDKAGLPYIDHPLRVLEKVKAQGALPYVQIAAVLLDVTEDTKFSPDMLLALGFAEPAVEIVKLVDRGHSEYDCIVNADCWTGIVAPKTHPDWEVRKDEYYYNQIKRNPGALMVKLADIEDNLSPWRLSYFSDETRKRLEKKYALARELLGRD